MANDSVEQTFAALVEFIANKFLRGEVNVADLIGLDDQEIRIDFPDEALSLQLWQV